MGQLGTFDRLRVDRLLVGFGVWCLSECGSKNAAWIDDVAVEVLPGQTATESPALTLNGRSLLADARDFDTDFDASLRAPGEDKAQKKANAKPTVCKLAEV